MRWKFSSVEYRAQKQKNSNRNENCLILKLHSGLFTVLHKSEFVFKAIDFRFFIDWNSSFCKIYYTLFISYLISDLWCIIYWKQSLKLIISKALPTVGTIWILFGLCFFISLHFSVQLFRVVGIFQRALLTLPTF